MKYWFIIANLAYTVYLYSLSSLLIYSTPINFLLFLNFLFSWYWTINSNAYFLSHLGMWSIWVLITCIDRHLLYSWLEEDPTSIKEGVLFVFCFMILCREQWIWIWRFHTLPTYFCSFYLPSSPCLTMPSHDYVRVMYLWSFTNHQNCRHTTRGCQHCNYNHLWTGHNHHLSSVLAHDHLMAVIILRYDDHQFGPHQGGYSSTFKETPCLFQQQQHGSISSSASVYYIYNLIFSNN